MSDHMTNDHKDNVYIGVTEACDLIGYDRSTLIRHLKKHESFITWKMRGKEYRILLNDIDKLKTIKKYYEVENDGDAVNERLEREGFSVTIVYTAEENTDVVLVNDELQELKKMLQLLYQKSESDKQELLQEIQTSRVEVQSSRNEILELKQMVNRQNSDTSEKFRLMMEDKKQVAEEVEKELDAERKKGFFQKLFSK